LFRIFSVIAVAILLAMPLSAHALTFKSGEKKSFAHTNKAHNVNSEMHLDVFASEKYPSAIQQLAVPDNWPFKLNAPFRHKRRKKMHGWQSFNVNQIESCINALVNWTKNDEQSQLARNSDGCIQILGQHYFNTGEVYPISEVLLEWSKSLAPDFDIYPSNHSQDQYDTFAYLSVFSAFYAVYYDEFLINDDDRNSLNNYLRERLLTLNIDEVGEPEVSSWCNPREHSKIGVHGQAKPPNLNSCGSNRWKLTSAQLLLGLRLVDQELFDKGTYNTRFMLLLFDDEGIFVPWAVRGALAYKYSHDVPHFLSLLSEVYAAVGYDFLSHQLENGLTVADLLSKQFEIVEDVSLLEKYAVRQWSVKGTNFEQWREQSNAERVKEWPLNAQLYSSPLYLQKPSVTLSEKFDCATHALDAGAITNFNLVDIWELHLGGHERALCGTETSLSLPAPKDKEVLQGVFDCGLEIYRSIEEEKGSQLVGFGEIQIKDGLLSFKEFEWQTGKNPFDKKVLSERANLKVLKNGRLTGTMAAYAMFGSSDLTLLDLSSGRYFNFESEYPEGKVEVIVNRGLKMMVSIVRCQ